MNLHRNCMRCGEFFPVEPLELKFFCNKEGCPQKYYFTPRIHLERIKRTRFIPTDYLDLYDLDRPILTDKGKVISYERVCRICGGPLLNKDGKYSYHRRYCSEHTGYELWAKYNWGIVSKNYGFELQENQRDKITIILKRIPTKLQNSVSLCELCGKPCLIYEYYCRHKYEIDAINIHHKIPVHTLNWDNIRLIWDFSNLVALCPECHNKQDHQLKTKVDPYINFKKITNFI